MNDKKLDKKQLSASRKTLIKSTVLALVIAILTLVLFILPAEYNIDITGVGEKIGLTVLAQPHEPLQAPSQVSRKTEQQPPVKLSQDKVNLIVPAQTGIEYKFYLAKHQKMTYQWQTDGPVLYVDLHGEPDGDNTGYYESYTITTAQQVNGQFTTPFDGVHGWYWKNNTDNDMTLTLTTQGNYRLIGLKK